MTKNTRKNHRQHTRSERKNSTEKAAPPMRFTRIKNFSKRILHDYVIPMTRTLEHRLQRLEQAL